MNTTTPTPVQAPPLWKGYLAFLVPMIISNILQGLSGTVNNIYLGQMLGVGAMAAVSAFFPVLFFLIAFMIGLGAGASVLIGQAWGAKEFERVRAITGTTLMVGLYAGLVVAVFGGAFTEGLLRALGTPADILPDAVAYARISMMAAPGIFFFLLITSMMRGVGDTKTPLKTLIIATVVGLAVTPALIQGWFGLPRLGVASGAWASVVSFLAAIAWTAWHMLRVNHPMAPNAAFKQHLRVDRAILAKVLRIGLPTGLSMITISLAEIAVLFLVNRYGSQATAAYGAVNQIVNYVQFPAISIAITASILGAQAIGGGRTHMLGAIVRTGIYMNLVLTGSLVLLGYAFSRAMLGLFITDPAVVELAQTLLHIMLWSSVIMGMSMVLSGLMRASGVVLWPTAISMFAIGCVEVPVAWLLSAHYGLNGIWVAYPVAFLVMLGMQTAYYRLVWRKLTIRRL
ncbi:MATE family efflux transporter [Rhodoferax saidenbachensis]|uniref:MATE family efflux transporter n=1 Tax=Rhodoferax saidenbachensis TaxID=1484693 RepID=A0A1P8K6N3_9BURK|nr:MATE family efflux transporter [Rhodoferax saidenbachensis]APW41683.1 MATE family efflux transporter [Rhodoferax saidenbachensis]